MTDNNNRPLVRITETTNFIPNALKAQKNWVLWRLETNKDGRSTKIPYSAVYNGKASSVKPTGWTDYDNAMKVLNNNPDKYSGLGFMLGSSRLIFTDIDHCINEDGALSDTAKDVIGAFSDKTFVEVSQSGSGLHIFSYGEIDSNFNNRKSGVEMYKDKRFCALTGNAFIAAEPADDREAILYIHSKYKTKKERVIKGNSEGVTIVMMEKSDRELLDYARKGKKNGALFRRLYDNGDITGYESHSEADMALLNILAFWFDRDPDRMRDAFINSALCRDKFINRPDYADRTIEEACAGCRETFTEYRRRKEREHFETFTSCDLLF